MLFPSRRYSPDISRSWFLLPHDPFFAWVKARHSHAPKWDNHWHYPTISKALAAYLAEHVVRPPEDLISDLGDETGPEATS